MDNVYTVSPREKRASARKPVIITQNPIMFDLMSKIKLAAKTGARVLFTGENGTGKELFASLLHYYGNRADQSMVTINCGAIASELAESELFGHEKGAFTGAIQQKKGCFELADKGTLFLDEIGEMSPSTQVKLLRVVETGSLRRVGGKEEVKIDVNIISATNKILIDEVKFGAFREDLYYRLNVIELYLPPLRHRKEDIPLLQEYYLEYYTKKYNQEGLKFSDVCSECLLEYDWPGNIRELRNAVERCVVFSKGKEIGLEVLPPNIKRKETTLPENDYFLDKIENIIQIQVGTSLEEVERNLIRRTLSSVNDNKTEAAKILGFSRKTLHNKLHKYELEKQDIKNNGE